MRRGEIADSAAEFGENHGKDKENGTFGAVQLARECHLQNSAWRLICQVSSSGGGLPGRLDLERDSRRSLFLRDFCGIVFRSGAWPDNERELSWLKW